MTASSAPRVATRHSLFVMVGVLLLLLGLAGPAGAGNAPRASAAAAALATTTVVTVTSSQYTLGQSSRATATVRDRAGHTSRGTITFLLDGRAFARLAVDSLGRGTAVIPTSAAVGRHTVTATFAPGANAGHTGSSGAKSVVVTKATVNWTIKIPTAPVYAGNVVILVVIKGSRPIIGPVNLIYGGRIVQQQVIRADGSMAFRLKANWPAGNAQLSVSYAGNGFYAPARKLVVVSTRKAPTALALSTPSSVGYQAGSSAKVSVTGVGNTPSGAVTLLLDGQARSAKALAGGQATLAVPGMSAGSHTVTASYPGDVNHTGATRSATVTAAAASQCPVSASACVDLTHSLTWLQSGGRITYGPVSITSGRPGYRTPPGSFSVFWKDIDHHSSEFNNAPMPYSVFFNGGVAFHEGSLSVQSHGCIHLSQSAAQTYFSNLQVGDRVVVFGVAPY
ncbi:hypothetical protein ABIB25_003189 [Nakamurella sp. UYEF19]|uniref:Ig-like domain repeat protein n=1 Tax=Nakamurella sp. UYEF19 TaxID=1756392 RepID=UPI0033911BB9